MDLEDRDPDQLRKGRPIRSRDAAALDEKREKVLLAAVRWVDAFKRLERVAKVGREAGRADRGEMTNAEVELCDTVAEWRQSLHGPLGG
jgi:hypothetical protein